MSNYVLGLSEIIGKYMNELEKESKEDISLIKLNINIFMEIKSNKIEFEFKQLFNKLKKIKTFKELDIYETKIKTYLKTNGRYLEKLYTDEKKIVIELLEILNKYCDNVFVLNGKTTKLYIILRYLINYIENWSSIDIITEKINIIKIYS